MDDMPDTHYARSGEYHIAYQVIGKGPFDLVFIPGFVSSVEGGWENPQLAHFYRRLASFARVILFDKRGTGMSDPVPVRQFPTLEQRMDDVRAVMDAAGSRQAALVGVSEGGPLSLLFAASHPARTSAIVLIGAFARIAWAPDHPFGASLELHEGMLQRMEQRWGQGVLLTAFAPSLAGDAVARDAWARLQRRAASPSAAAAATRMAYEIDVRSVLPAVRVPTLILHRTGDRMVSVEHARYFARHIPGAKLLELPGVDHFFWVGDADAYLDHVQEFLTGERHVVETDRILASILFVDIVGSTEKAARLGDAGWHGLLDRFYSVARRQLERFRGHEVDSAGDGLFASFDGPARAVRCAAAIGSGVRLLGLEVRAGVHAGECEVIGTKIGGIAVHIGARVASHASPNEVLVSSTVKDLVAGSGMAFQDRGVHSLKGVPGQWHLYAATESN
ncbi:adenylate/guanylate cyclase domain-containing protein [Variovorax sp. J31P207]|uniref:adenylate/guanylate cyclase domain-containing protein n=1 Tax=Variovorax sp. J31P207 TaxID=3053510 RepID=UPI0025781599|nr:adenylate/guanylate cyclase domain-containing protein [Variovorax sp. J31P207]MDM0071226.1 adenylate/guanylate cyclase domain-containing protein [Variovorax sp. J31P207]